MATGILNLAKKNKADEFYTQMSDIENELRHYQDQFRVGLHYILDSE